MWSASVKGELLYISVMNGDTQVTVTKDKKAVLPVAAGIAEAALGYFGNLMRQKHEERMAQEQRDYNLEMWKRQNEYNSPAAQIERLKAAGLNPHLLYGQGVRAATGQADAVPGYEQPGSVDPFQGVNPFKNYQSFKNQEVSNDLRIATQRLMQQREDNELLRYNSDALELAAQGLEMDLKGTWSKNDRFNEQIRTRGQAIISKNAIARINYELASVTKEDRALIIEENATRAFYDALSARAQYLIRNQYLKAGPYAAQDATVTMLMAGGMSENNARMLAPGMINIARSGLDLVKKPLTLKQTKFQKQKPLIVR